MKRFVEGRDCRQGELHEDKTGRTNIGRRMKQFRCCVLIHRRCDRPTRRSPRAASLLAISATEPDWGRVVRHQAQTFIIRMYWLASKAWERKGLPLGAARALANAGFLKMDDPTQLMLWNW